MFILWILCLVQYMQASISSCKGNLIYTWLSIATYMYLLKEIYINISGHCLVSNTLRMHYIKFTNTI